MCANPGQKHQIPAPRRLLPERQSHGEDSVFNHVLVTAPDIVNQYIQPTLVIRDAIEYRLNLIVVAMITNDSSAFAIDIFHVFRCATGDVNGGSGICQFLSDAFPNTAAGSGY